MTRSPGRYWVTPSPTAAITPEVSCPKMRGAEWEPVEIFLRSLPQTPQECPHNSISPGPILGTGTVSTRTSFMPRYTAACIVVGMDCGGSSTAWESAVAMCVTLDDVSTGLPGRWRTWRCHCNADATIPKFNHRGGRLITGYCQPVTTFRAMLRKTSTDQDCLC